MIDPKSFVSLLDDLGVRLFSGVPDSILQGFCSELLVSVPEERHVIAANEGAALALAAGWHLGTDATPCVYMQNSGLGNAVNPLVSLADGDVYGIPMLLIIGWRGEVRAGEQLKDEPQHVKMGRITLSMLDCLEIPYEVIGGNTANVEDLVTGLVRRSESSHRPVALVVRRGTFLNVHCSIPPSQYALQREDVLALLVEALPTNAIFVATTGKLARELYEYRIAKKQRTDGDFLTVGSMGHALQIAAGVAMTQPSRRVVCLDGDGAMLMHMGALANAAIVSNLLHVVINNGAHESVGGQPTAGFRIDMPAIARGCGYASSVGVETPSAIRGSVMGWLATSNSGFIEVRTKPGARKNLGRPKTSTMESKAAFMERLREDMT